MAGGDSTRQELRGGDSVSKRIVAVVARRPQSEIVRQRRASE
jgi:hypothetical protein